jgi:hypothetical protein
MKNKLFSYGTLCLLLILCINKTSAQSENAISLANNDFELTVSLSSTNINVKITDKRQNVIWSDGTYHYAIGEMISGKLQEYSGLELRKLERQFDRIRIRGLIGGFEIEHDLILAGESTFIEEEMTVVNTQSVLRNVKQFTASFTKKVTELSGKVSDNHIMDRFQAVPFLHRSDDSVTYNQHDYTLQQIVEGKGFCYYTTDLFWDPQRRHPSNNFISEGWGWRHKDAILGIFSFNQDNMIFSTISYSIDGSLHFGGFTKEGLNLSALERFEPNNSVYLGMNRFYHISGGYNQVAYKYRDMLDELGCRFPKDYNPPVHWEQLYSKNMENAWMGKRELFTRENLFTNEVKKAKEYSCQALYLDPGWDTEFGSFLWANNRLGDCKDYVDMVKKNYELKTSLHTPLSQWATNEMLIMGPSSVNTWPVSSKRLIMGFDSISKSEKIIQAKVGPQICFLSKQYLDEAEQRLLKLCEAGVTFLMFDGPHWNGNCVDPNHEHPIPILYEDQVDACIGLTRRIHQKYPNVLIEMHDMLTGGGFSRSVPVYYKYGLPGSYDENWGFELMWSPFKHLQDKSALALYYYNLGCNVPLYLHVDIGQDNANGILLWWYASTCRHLGIGVNNIDSVIEENHKKDMKLYSQLQNFFKRGDFYGINEEIHIHTLPDQQESVINIFNLSDNPEVTEGAIDLSEIGLDPKKKYSCTKEWIRIVDGKLIVKKSMKPWDTDLAIIRLL